MLPFISGVAGAMPGFRMNANPPSVGGFGASANPQPGFGFGGQQSNFGFGAGGMPLMELPPTPAVRQATNPVAPVNAPQNSLQRWQGGGQARQLSPQRRYFWSTGRVDAQATPSPMNNRDSLTAEPDWRQQFQQRRPQAQNRTVQQPQTAGTVARWSPY